MIFTEYTFLTFSLVMLLASIQIIHLKAKMLKLEKKKNYKIQRESSMNNTILYITKKNRIELNLFAWEKWKDVVAVNIFETFYEFRSLAFFLYISGEMKKKSYKKVKLSTFFLKKNLVTFYTNCIRISFQTA